MFVFLCISFYFLATSFDKYTDDVENMLKINFYRGNTDNLSNKTEGCPPHIDYFFDGEYVTTIDVFVPSRGSRFVFGPWPGNKNWAGQGSWKNAEILIDSVSICPFNENFDAM